MVVDLFESGNPDVCGTYQHMTRCYHQGIYVKDHYQVDNGSRRLMRDVVYEQAQPRQRPVGDANTDNIAGQTHPLKMVAEKHHLEHSVFPRIRVAKDGSGLS